MKIDYIGDKPRIAVRSTGGGPLVLFLHGIGGNSLNWTGQLAAAGAFCRAAAWDMRGYGLSDDYDGSYDLDAVAGDLSGIIDHFGADRAHIVGLSMGGMVALEYYRRAPERVASLFLCNTNAGIGRDYSAAQKEEFVRLRKTPLIEGRTLKELVPGMLAVLLGAGPSPAAVEAITDSLLRLHPASYVKAIEAIIAFDCADVLPTISVPVHLVAGNEDRVTPLATMEVMQAAIPGAVLDVITPAGHLSNLEQPERFNEILLGFLQRQIDADRH